MSGSGTQRALKTQVVEALAEIGIKPKGRVIMVNLKCVVRVYLHTWDVSKAQDILYERFNALLIQRVKGHWKPHIEVYGEGA